MKAGVPGAFQLIVFLFRSWYAASHVWYVLYLRTSSQKCCIQTGIYLYTFSEVHSNRAVDLFSSILQITANHSKYLKFSNIIIFALLLSNVAPDDDQNG